MSSLGSSTSTVRPLSLPPSHAPPAAPLPLLCSALLCTTDRQRHFVSLGTLLSLPPLSPAPLQHVSPIPPHCLTLPALLSACLLAADPSTPLLVFYAPHVAHCPLQVPKEYYDKFSFMEDDEGEKTNGPRFFGFSCVCPEPVLANRRVSWKRNAQKAAVCSFLLQGNAALRR